LIGETYHHAGRASRYLLTAQQPPELQATVLAATIATALYSRTRIPAIVP
jgi:hypothetical protein